MWRERISDAPRQREPVARGPHTQHDADHQQHDADRRGPWRVVHNERMGTRHIARTPAAAVVALLLVFPAVASAQVAEVAEPVGNPLLGEWRAVSVQAEGRDVDFGPRPRPFLKFSADGTASGMDGLDATWTTDDASSPGRLVMSHKAGGSAGTTQHCVYEVKDGKLTIVFSVPGVSVADAPVKLDSTHKPRLAMMVFERVGGDGR